MTAAETCAGRQSFLVVFDFDHTVVDCNTDEVVPQYLGRGDFQRALLAAETPMQPTNIVDAVLAPFSREQLEDAVEKSVVMDAGMPDIFRFLLQQQQQQQQRRGAPDEGVATRPQLEIAIASDANMLFIEKSIEHHIPFARHAIAQIHSNSFHDVFDGGELRRCRVGWYEAAGHNCPNCNGKNHLNMCKSRIVARLLHASRLIDPTIIFVGDGANDFCPVLNMLRPRDYFLGRRGFAIHRLLSDERSAAGGCCRVDLWSNANELLQSFKRAMDPAERLPTLARFRDVGPREFRTVTLLQRVPQVLARTLKANETHITAEARRLIDALAEATRNNAAVAPLPGQQVVPPWLQAYAAVPEYDRDAHALPQQQRRQQEAGGGAVVAPRWGQLPWLLGEIYFYNLLAQYVLLAEAGAGSDAKPSADDWAPNILTPYAVCNPIGTHDCPSAPHGVMTATGATPGQSFDASFLAKDGSTFGSDTIVVQDGKLKYRDIAAGDAVVPRQGYFQPYRDFFMHEKCEVLHNFLKCKICPMLACAPWESDDSFVPVLLRWMLWGNGVDLSMFTLEQLRESHAVAAAGSGSSDGKSEAWAREKRPEGFAAAATDALRLAEAQSVAGQDDRILGNQVAAVAQLIRSIVRTEPGKDEAGSRTIDIVMDNVGVECVADLIFCLWLLHHHPSLRVTLHVKCMAFYVSDVTPPDIAFLLQELEACALQEPAMAAVLTPFLRLVREALGGGRLRIDADAVWTQPSEYRELPPRVCNTFFFTQRLLSEAEMQQQQQQQAQAQAQAQQSTSFSYDACKRYTSHSALVIFKGDLNFRRLVGDRHWDRHAFVSTLTPTERDAPAVSELLLADTPHACHGQRRPAQEGEDAADEIISFQRIVSSYWPVHAVPVCAIRTIKSEVSIGVGAARQKALDRADPTWRTSGKYGVILLASGSL
ncbi:Phosphoethanolamine/phosphocholine phosphatase [Trypanosoma conorhini]|uniref:Phosphoethanolamine/phosphocholine phosphatase n=1 Tax=Trypanosoma conorhini TaxID=83891 RepID=A0A422Q5X1_9TRYP|nr:Phosphoethanolamine/phosphocholine phosphatase [Trypanosoma conorhini]RNF25366.1 Phosphoethanolamine/phosphocholine phosphatase [Trypanosoma conorhini]